MMRMISEPALQTAMSISIPTFAVLVGILINNSRLSDLRAHIDARLADLKETRRSELRRVEDVFDARLKHFEER
jgi:hypothetical protein